MRKKHTRFHIGMRTLKTAIAVVVSMIIVEFYGATTSKLIFAMLGAMAAVQPTFKESIESCLSQTIGVLFGALAGVVLLTFPLHPLVNVGVGMVLVITLYNVLRIHFSPSIPCFILVTLCTTPDIQPISYALGRVWDTTIGLGVGFLINTLFFPYNNSRLIRGNMENLAQELIAFLEDLFDGNDVLPDLNVINKKLSEIDRQLKIFANQKLLMHLRRQKNELDSFRDFERKAYQVVSHMEVLCRMGLPGRLNDENRQRLLSCGATILDQRPLNSVTEKDVVTNYHVRQILTLRQELLEAMEKSKGRRL